MKRFFLPTLLTLAGLVLIAGTQLSDVLRFPKAEAASYLFTGVGVVWLAFAVFGQLTKVAPEVGRTVVFWGPDGRTKVEGEIVERAGNQFVVRTQAGNYTLDEDHFLKVR